MTKQFVRVFVIEFGVERRTLWKEGLPFELARLTAQDLARRGLKPVVCRVNLNEDEIAFRSRPKVRIAG